MPKSANILKAKRGALELTQKEVADLMGIKQAQYSRYETKKEVPNHKNIAKLAEALDLPREVVNSFFD